MGLRELLLILLVCYATAQEKTRLVIAPTTQSGGFLHGHDVGPMNPHSYRPNEFFANDFVFEGLVAWNSSSLGVDAKKGTLDDGVVPALAASWTTTATDSGMEITFKLTPDVTFHDGEKWDAAAAVINFDHIMGCKGGCIGEKKASRGGFHDWWGLGGAIKSWSAVDEMTFKLTFKHYYEAALRELSTIRPFRMASPKVLPDMNQGLLSCNEWKKGAPRVHKEFTCNGVKAPIGTGPYKVVEKIISDGSATPKTRSIAADKFHESCWAAADPNKSCKYNAGEFVAEVRFEKHVGHRAFKNEGGKKAFDAVIARSYKNQLAVQASLLDGSLDMVYGVGALPPSVFLRLSTSEGGELVSHRASHVINTRSIVLNSIGALNTPEKRKAVMGVIDRQPLIDGELAEEKPADTLFDPEMPYCKDSVNLKSIKELAAEAPASAKASLQTTANVKPLKFIYKKDIPHESIIASKIIADLYIAGISVEPLVLSKGDYNAAMNSWLGADGEALSADDANATTPIYCATNPPVSGTLGCISFDLAYSETWGPPYDPASKLFDMTYEWGSGEADAVATTNLGAITRDDFKEQVRALSAIKDDGERQIAYTSILTALHKEAVFLPISRKKNIAVVNKRVSGFEFGSMEFDIPLTNLYPTQPETTSLPGWAIACIVIACVVVLGLVACIIMMIMRERKGEPMFMPLTMRDDHYDFDRAEGTSGHVASVSQSQQSDAPFPHGTDVQASGSAAKPAVLIASA